MEDLFKLACMDRILRKLSPLSEKETVEFLTALIELPGPLKGNIETFLIEEKDHIMYSSMEIYYRFLLTGIPPLDNLLTPEELQEAEDKVIKGYRNYFDSLYDN